MLKSSIGKRKLSSSSYEKIKDEVSILVEDHGVTNWPIDVSRLARQLDVTLRPVCTADWKSVVRELPVETDDGFTMYDNGQFTIFFIDDFKYRRRIRFTIAHELGHIWLDHFFDDSDMKCHEVKEAEANFFASCLLVPIPLLLVMQGEVTASVIESRFDVSAEVSRIAYQYYVNRLSHGGQVRKPYEQRLLRSVFSEQRPVPCRVAK